MQINLKESLENNFNRSIKESLEREEILITNPSHKKIKTLVNYQWYDCVKLFLYEFFINEDLFKAKNHLFNAGKSDEFLTKYFESYIRPEIIYDRITYILLSDSKELIKSFSNWKFKTMISF
ncbi:hypothetical protein [Psychroserpens damuponensis]|uniref:hypothetical protein n=1 Tax=Psychroserpens damuponensis TaxID=943936 RepID=UPI00058D9DC9|nr:hypothetical protein [Psychroserpens damuponensis]